MEHGEDEAVHPMVDQKQRARWESTFNSPLATRLRIKHLCCEGTVRAQIVTIVALSYFSVLTNIDATDAILSLLDVASKGKAQIMADGGLYLQSQHLEA